MFLMQTVIWSTALQFCGSVGVEKLFSVGEDCLETEAAEQSPF